MRIDHIEHGGRGYVMMTAGQLAEAGVPAEAIAAVASPQIIAAGHAALLKIAHRAFTADAVQASIYTTKHQQAVAYLAAGSPAQVAAGDYPFLVAEAPARGMTKQALATLIVAKGNAWAALAAAIEAARARITADVMAASDIAAMQASVAAIIASIEAAASALPD